MEIYKMIKKVIVFLNKDRYEIEVDSDEFDDYKLEACTRVIERLFGAKKFSIPPIIFCDEVIETKSKKCVKSGTYNSYKLIINAGYHAKAEILRTICWKQNSIDLANEPIQSIL